MKLPQLQLARIRLDLGRRRPRQAARRRVGHVEWLETRILLTATPYGATSQDTGEFMLGTVLVTPVFLESTGAVDPSTEDWTPILIEEAKSRVEQGVQWWEETLANYNMVHSLDFIFDFQYAEQPVPTKYEPISRISNDYTLWVNEFLDHVGFQSPESLHHDIREFNHAQREAHGTDWAFTIFVVNSANDTDGQFAPGGSFSRAFAFAGGRFFVSPSTRPASTFAHETGHMFWARDEYIGGGSYLDFRGYYNTQNWNAANNPTPGFVHQPSIMASGSSLDFAYQMHVSAASTLEMIGWRDSNGNGVFDVLDVPHRLEGVGDWDAVLQQYRFQGRAEVGTLPNLNPSGLQNDITLNRITRVEYRIDGGPWDTAAEPGTFVAELDLRIDVPAEERLVEIRTITLDPGTQQLVTSSPIFSGWSHQRTATRQPGIQGFLWNDVDADGEWDAGETPLAGHKVRLVNEEVLPLPGPQELDPDHYGDQDTLNQQQPGVTLRAVGINVSGNSVLSRTSPQASTGSRVFGFRDPLGHARLTWFREGSELHVDFETPQTHVQLDAIGISDSFGSAGRLEAYNAAGQLIGRYNTLALAPGQFETMTIERSTAEIASIRAFGRSLQPVMLDQLRWGPPAEVAADRFGSYRFTGLAAGTYHVAAVTSAGAVVTVPGDSTYQVMLEGGTAAAGRDFGIHPRWPWQNPLNRYDVNGDGKVNPFDVLVLVAGIRTADSIDLPFPSAERSPPAYYDVSGTGQLTPFDALLVVSHLLDQGPGANSMHPAGGFSRAGLGWGSSPGEGEEDSESGRRQNVARRDRPRGTEARYFPPPPAAWISDRPGRAESHWARKVDAALVEDHFFEELEDRSRLSRREE